MSRWLGGSVNIQIDAGLFIAMISFRFQMYPFILEEIVLRRSEHLYLLLMYLKSSREIIFPAHNLFPTRFVEKTFEICFCLHDCIFDQLDLSKIVFHARQFFLSRYPFSSKQRRCVAQRTWDPGFAFISA